MKSAENLSKQHGPRRAGVDVRLEAGRIAIEIDIDCATCRRLIALTRQEAQTLHRALTSALAEQFDAYATTGDIVMNALQQIPAPLRRPAYTRPRGPQSPEAVDDWILSNLDALHAYYAALERAQLQVDEEPASFRQFAESQYAIEADHWAELADDARCEFHAPDDTDADEEVRS